jgi:ABC-2 type transport system permease protein
MAIFLIAIGLFVWVFPDTSVLAYGYADLGTLFSIAPFVLMFLVPAITMRSFAEERKTGTLELLFTMPLTDWEIILGKYFAAVSLVVFSILPTILYYITLYILGNPKGNIDGAGVFGSYLGLTLLGAGFCSIGILASALTDSQIVAFVVATFLCFMLYMGFNSLASVELWQDWSNTISQLGIAYHYNAMSKGLIDTRNLVYFASLIVLALQITRFTMRARLH